MARNTVSFSELDKFRQCPHAWYLSYVERWRPPTLSVALSRGSLFHEVLAIHYRGGPDAQSRIRSLLYDQHGEQTEVQRQVAWLYDGYRQMWGTDSDWKVLAVEQRINHPLVEGLKLNGVIDLVVRVHSIRGIWLVDHKTHREMPNERKLELDDQMPLYAWLLRKLGKPILGAIYNVARTYEFKNPVPLEKRYARFFLHYTDELLDTVAREALATVSRRDQIQSLAEAERNTGEHCVFRCDYTESCLAGRKGQDEYMFMRSKGFVRE